MPTPVNVICMKWGRLYGPEYVNHLRAGVARHLSRPHRFVCFTDDARGIDAGVDVQPLPHLSLPAGERDLRWRKLAVFQRQLAGLAGPTLFLDLDLVIVAPLDDFFDVPGAFRIILDDELFHIRPWRRLRGAYDAFRRIVGNSSVFRFEAGELPGVLDDYLADAAAASRAYGNEQEYLSGWLQREGKLEYWPRGWCVSFKNACVPHPLRSFVADPAVPQGARIVVFAGTPKMSDVLDGRGGTWYRRIGKVDWLRAAWAR